jgi:RNA-splicing ligase RtcB
MPITINGKYNTAIVYAKAVEANCEDKIRQYLDHEAFAGTKVRIMPDVHLGKSTVIGFTSTCTGPLIPSIVGTDIGCGVVACNLGKGNLRFDKLDSFIRKNIPSGMDTRTCLHERLEDAASFLAERSNGLGTAPETAANLGTTRGALGFKSAIRKLCEKQKHSVERVFSSLATLGGGNHFIEVDVDENHNRWLLIHSGSRVLGAHTAEYHEIIALRETDGESNLKYLTAGFAAEYQEDMALVQRYARVNRCLMAMTLAEGFFKVKMADIEYIESIHNYIDLANRIIRKGAISAAAGERVVIPFSMSEGAVIARGKGNAEWNCSAPHGAGRKISRSQARSGLSLDEYRRRMHHIWSSTVCKETLDESPMAYKKPKDVLNYVGEAVDIDSHLTPVYNFKAVE